MLAMVHDKADLGKAGRQILGPDLFSMYRGLVAVLTVLAGHSALGEETRCLPSPGIYLGHEIGDGM
jgi:hypothetical protein